MKTHEGLQTLCQGLPLNPLPPRRQRDESVPHAPVRTPNLNPEEERVSSLTAIFTILSRLKRFMNVFSCRVTMRPWKSILFTCLLYVTLPKTVTISQNCVSQLFPLYYVSPTVHYTEVGHVGLPLSAQ